MVRSSKFIFLVGALLFIGLFWFIYVTNLYFNQFGSFNKSNDQAIWGQFGDYLGGIANPFFGFLTFMAISFSLILQNIELKLTREEIARSAEIQKLSEQALKAQAKASEQSVRLETINLLLSHYSDELSRMKRNSHPNSPYGTPNYAFTEDKKNQLTQLLDTMYKEVIKEITP
jgi:hypothetical protein